MTNLFIIAETDEFVDNLMKAIKDKSYMSKAKDAAGKPNDAKDKPSVDGSKGPEAKNAADAKPEDKDKPSQVLYMANLWFCAKLQWLRQC